VTGLAQQGKAQSVRLCVDGRAIAALIVLRSGNAGWVWKIAHDENYARYSPGVQVLLDATESLLADDRVQYVDSCATADHPMMTTYGASALRWRTDCSPQLPQGLRHLRWGGDARRRDTCSSAAAGCCGTGCEKRSLD
jgi:hypothetical protein